MKKVYTFRLLYSGDDDFVRDFEVCAGQTLQDFHLAIQENLNYDISQMASFFLTDDTWEKGEEIPVINMTDDPGTRTMRQFPLEDNNIEKLDRLLYVFDYLSNRGFFIELVHTGQSEKGMIYPRCIRSEGEPPAQMELDDDLSFLPDNDLDEEDGISFENLDDLPDI
ncbi:MAG: plasmid pRiA4b ORF-3 family protein [Chlorobi bacterium]|nr:plasmid pRiA4b ORF-3 family protein [Chlorobiota bacterium]